MQVAGSSLVMQVKVNEEWYGNMLSVKNEWRQRKKTTIPATHQAKCSASDPMREKNGYRSDHQLVWQAALLQAVLIKWGLPCETKAKLIKWLRLSQLSSKCMNSGVDTHGSVNQQKLAEAPERELFFVFFVFF